MLQKSAAPGGPPRVQWASSIQDTLPIERGALSRGAGSRAFEGDATLAPPPPRHGATTPPQACPGHAAAVAAPATSGLLSDERPARRNVFHVARRPPAGARRTCGIRRDSRRAAAQERRAFCDRHQGLVPAPRPQVGRIPVHVPSLPRRRQVTADALGRVGGEHDFCGRCLDRLPPSLLPPRPVPAPPSGGSNPSPHTRSKRLPLKAAGGRTRSADRRCEAPAHAPLLFAGTVREGVERRK
jgi:hypothetical protein